MSWDSWARGRLRATAFLVVCVLAGGVVACGSGDDANDSEVSAESSDASGGDASTKEQIEAVYDGYADDVEAGRYEEACAALTDSYEREFAKQISSLLTEQKAASSCPDALRLTNPGGSKPRRSPIVSVTIDSANRATAVVKLPLADAKAPFTFEKQDGEWKLAGGGDDGSAPSSGG